MGEIIAIGILLLCFILFYGVGLAHGRHLERQEQNSKKIIKKA